jgi:hypothetical protein
MDTNYFPGSPAFPFFVFVCNSAAINSHFQSEEPGFQQRMAGEKEYNRIDYE